MKIILLVPIIWTSLSCCNNNAVTKSDTRTDSPAIKLTPADSPAIAEISVPNDSPVHKKESGKSTTNPPVAPPITCTPNPDSSILNMKVIPQEEYQWCWAACGEMVMEKLPRRPVSQCDQVRRQFAGMGLCCNRPRARDCDRSGLPRFDQYGFDVDTTICQPLSWDEIKNQIDCKHKAFCATWRDTDDDIPCSGTTSSSDTSGHMIVISGYKIADNGDRMVKILDPWPKDTGATYLLRYSEYVCGRAYAHWNDYYNIRQRQR
jgi:hypothetical protein